MSQARMPRTSSGGARAAADSGPIPIRRATPPINPQNERAALGALILAPEHLASYGDLIDEEDWYEPKHKALFAAIVQAAAQWNSDASLDEALINEALRKAGQFALVGHGYVTSCTNECGSAFIGGKRYIRTVLELGTRRREAAIGEALRLQQVTNAQARAMLQLLDERLAQFDSGEASHRLGFTLDEVETKAIRWLWHGRLAYGKVTLWDGDAGLGKGLCGDDLTARLTQGWPMPGELDRRPPANVILITPEDDAADTIKPRLLAMGADVSRVRVLNTVDEIDAEGRVRPRSITFPRDAALVEREMIADGATFLIIDPIMGCLDPGVKTGIDSDVRAALMPLKFMVERVGAACLIVRHLNKSSGDNAQYRGGGSVAFGALARMHYILARHPDHEDKRVLAPIKVNIAKTPEAIAFSIVTPDGLDGWPRISWDNGTVDYGANELLGNVKMSNERRQIVRVLHAANRNMSPSDVAEEMGIEPDDKAGQTRVRVAMHRMKKANQIKDGATYGTYTTL